MSQSTEIQRYPISPAVIEEAEKLGDRHTHRLRGLDLRVLIQDDEPWFVARDICSALLIANVSDAVGRLDEDERKTDKLSVVSNDPSDDQRKVSLVSEAGLYSMIMGSRLPAARAFKRWVTHEVLPAIRKTGAYAVPVAPKTRVELARELLAAEERAEEMERDRDRAIEALGEVLTVNESMQPKVQVYEALLSSDRDWSLRDAAMILNRDPHIMATYKLGQNLLHWYMLGERPLLSANDKLKMLDRNGRIYAAHKTHLTLRPTPYNHPNTGEPRVSEQVRITARGLIYLQKRFSGGDPALLKMDEPTGVGEDLRPLPAWAK